ncbi:putative nucleic acid-binding Zn finger protein [Clostridium tetanomorphum]|uniref:SWIM zinc finger family protein n=1 Tax=Clostridium tetanomorphum TaxID=1553 RepID=UPI000447E12D|nr:SWIM zinc finger family protein [Clostridium tetanomorphum]KAJ51908.1 zinc finger SWIM domain-containing protein [Clostridium tetanomorphum DSM 665]MBP1864087.1 putative nucleic acid-binding Zn finger protein [Clostridium tetanomorphum]NRS84500.1 putative nucleic acid-binding Zn finger protein [Clostridium tetanomorphum]SQB92005.1 SWIM zinc finger [Clostridium tetanomorphum]
MINLSKEYIDSLATNASAMKNGNKLSKDGSFVKLNKSEDESIIFGECKGSGKNNYLCSADFINESNPVFRCSCPSKQFPCKHTLGLLYAFVDGKKFTVENIPEDIIEKRAKIEKKEQNKIEKKKAPAKKNKSAIKKKINAQLEGIELLDKIVKGILKQGFASIHKENIKELNSQLKELGNYYIPGVQAELKRLIEKIFDSEVDNENALMQAIYLKSLVKEGKKHLLNRLEDEEMNLSVSSDMEELLGHAWKLTELEELDQFKKDVNLVQLSFSSYVDTAREEYIDEGIFLDLNTGEIRNTYNYRPLRRKSDAEGEYAPNCLLEIPTLYIYPGQLNLRVRWEEMIIKEMQQEHYEKAFSFGEKSYAHVIKKIKNYIKNPLVSKMPSILLRYSTLGKVENNWVIEDEEGNRLVLNEDEYDLGYKTGCRILPLLNSKYMKDGAMLVKFHYNIQTRSLELYPLSVLTENEIIRLTY